MIGRTNAPGGKDRLRYRVFGGTTPPANPIEYDFYVKTTTPISFYEMNYWTNVLPTWTATNGHVYIVSDTWTDNQILNLVKGNNRNLLFVPRWCWQYINGTWYQMEAYVYKNGSWVKFSDYKYTPPWSGTLFYNGDQYTDITGGWVGNGLSSTTVGTNLSLIVANSSPYLTTQNAIDLSGYTKLHMIADRNAGQYSYFGISRNVPSNARPDYIASAVFSGGENVLDISAINSGHISIGATASWGVTINISKVWLT